MERRHAYLLVFVIFSLVLISLSAVFDTIKPLTGYVAFDPTMPPPPVVQTTPVPPPIVVAPDPTELLKSDIQSLTLLLSQTEQKVTGLETNYNSLQQELARISGNIDLLRQEQAQLQTQMEGKVNTLATGLAGLQQNVEQTKSEITQVGNDLEKKQQSTSTLLYAIIFVVIAAIAGGAVYYFTSQNKSSKKQGSSESVTSEIASYITKHIKNGKKYPHIKEKLLQAGWQEDDVEWAYQQTLKKNYQEYKGSDKGEEKSVEGFSLTTQQKTIVMVAGVGLFIVVLFFLLTKGSSTGQAYNYYGGVADYEESIPLDTTATRCSTGKIFSNQRCCYDLNTNNICDDTENFVEESAPSAQGTIIVE